MVQIDLGVSCLENIDSCIDLADAMHYCILFFRSYQVDFVEENAISKGKLFYRLVFYALRLLLVKVGDQVLAVNDSQDGVQTGALLQWNKNAWDNVLNVVMKCSKN